MKKILLIFAFVITCSFSFAEELTGFMGIPFGASKNNVKEVMEGYYFTSPKTNSQNTLDFYRNIHLYGIELNKITFHFDNDYFVGVDIEFDCHNISNREIDILKATFQCIYQLSEPYEMQDEYNTYEVYRARNKNIVAFTEIDKDNYSMFMIIRKIV